MSNNPETRPVEITDHETGEKTIEHLPVDIADEMQADVDASEREKQQGQQLRVGVIGNNVLSQAAYVAFDTRNVERFQAESLDDIDRLCEWRPTLSVYCADIPLLKNDTLDDSDFINTMVKLVKTVDSSILVRTTLNIETIERLIVALGYEVFNAKVIYMPEFSSSQNIGDLLVNDFQAIGGDEKALQAFTGILKHTTHFSAKEIVTGSIFEIAYAKLGVAGFKAVKQTFFNQLHETILDVKNANPTIVRRLIEKAPDLNDKSVMVPTFVRSRTDDTVSYKQARSYSGEFENDEVRMLAGMTDRIPLVDECINYRNLKD